MMSFAVSEMWNSGTLAFAIAPTLTMGAVEALEKHASKELKDIYLEKLISGEWMGTMNLTEPQAGSDVGALRTRAERSDDGSYRVFGQKIFITYGAEHLRGFLALLQASDPTRDVKSVKWMRTIETPEEPTVEL